MALDSFEIDEMAITLATAKPDKSLFNSQESATNLADTIVDKCGLTGQDEEDSYKSESKYFTRGGFYIKSDETYTWDLTLSDGKDITTAKISVRRLTY